MSERPLVYLIFGIAGSERRSILYDLIEGGLPNQETVLYFRPKDECQSTDDRRIEALANVSLVEWELRDAMVRHGRITAAPERIFFLAPSASNPADVAEAIKTWIDHNGCQLARIITVLNCAFLQSEEKAGRWYDACIHFSDIVLFARREGVDHKWMQAFEAHYRKACFPCHFELVVKGKTKNPVAVLEPEARRMSLYFDELIPIEEDEFEGEEKPEDTKPDPFIERNESGQRIRPIMSIDHLLSKEF